MFNLATWERNPWSIFDEFDSLQRDVSRALGAVDEERREMRRGAFPPINVWSSEEGLVLDVELPGVDAAAVEVSVLGNELNLSGEKVAVQPEKEEKLHRRERRAGTFKRMLKLPFKAESDGVKAHFQNGVLRVKVPRAEEEKPRRIQVEVS